MKITMKKIIWIVLLSAFAGTLCAQSAPGRTWKTKVSDALGLMPAPEGAEYKRLMEDLASTGADGVEMLTGMFDGTNNTPVAYALSGWAAYATGAGQEANRDVFARGIVSALKKAGDPEIKAFYIRLLQQCGGAESVDALAGLIGDARLGSPALVALASNGTPEARKAIADAVVSGRGDKTLLAHAVGDAKVGSDGVEDALLSWIGTDADTDKAVYYALAKIGTAKSVPVLRKAAEKAGFAGERTGAADDYVCLVERLRADGQVKLADGEAAWLLKKSAAAGSPQGRIAAARMLASQAGKSSEAFVLKAVKDPCRAYRNNVLEAAGAWADAALYAKLVPMLTAKSGDASMKVDLIDYFGAQGADEALPALLACFDDADSSVRAAAMWAAARIGGDGVPAALAEVLGSGDGCGLSGLLQGEYRRGDRSGSCERECLRPDRCVGTVGASCGCRTGVGRARCGCRQGRCCGRSRSAGAVGCRDGQGVAGAVYAARKAGSRFGPEYGCHSACRGGRHERYVGSRQSRSAYGPDESRAG